MGFLVSHFVLLRLYRAISLSSINFLLIFIISSSYRHLKTYF